MSIEAFKWAKGWAGSGLTSNQMFVFLMIADYYNEEHKRAWPAISTLARVTGMSVSTVTRCIRHLEANGYIERESWVKAGTNERSANRYCLPLYDEKSTRRDGKIRAFEEFDHTGKFIREEVTA